MRAADLIRDAAARLAAVGVPSPRVDAELLLAHAMGVSRSRLITAAPDAAQIEVFLDLIDRRCQRIPLQHLTGTAAFRHVELAVGPGVFIPRPETEHVAQIAIDEARLLRNPVVVDLCTGSGAIAIAVATEVPGAQVHAVEISEDALAWSRRNVSAAAEAVVGAGSQLHLHHGDATAVTGVDGPLSDLVGLVDVVISNPPYIPDAAVPRDPEVRDHDPHLALFGGPDGLDVVRGLVDESARLLREGGLLVIEHAEVQGVPAGEAPPTGSVGSVLEGGPWGDVSTGADLTGRPRFTRARRLAG